MTIRPMVRGALLVTSAELMFATMGAAIRTASEELDNPMIVFWRNFFGLLILLPWLLRQGRGALTTGVPALHLLRASAGLGAMYCFFYAIANMPLAEAMLLKLSAPLFIPFVAYCWLGEGVPWRIRAAIGIGFGGVALILVRDLGPVSPVALIALAGGALAAVAKVTLRRLGRSEPPVRTVFYFALVATLISAAPLPWFWHTPSSESWRWLGLIAVCATAGQILLTRGFSLAPAAALGPFTYFSVVFGAAYGWFFWTEPLAWTTFVGAVLVAGAGFAAGIRPRGSSGRETGSDEETHPSPAMSTADAVRRNVTPYTSLGREFWDKYTR